jgi:hypothetical protein
MSHSKLTKLREWYNGWSVPPQAQWITETSPKGRQLQEAVEAIWVEEGNKLVPISTDKWMKVLSVVKALIDAGSMDSPMIRKEGGGSRLPAAKGTLYIDSTVYVSKNDLLTRGLGIDAADVGDYDDVEEVFVPSGSVKSMPEATVLAQDADHPHISGSGYVYISTVSPRLRADRKVVAKKRQHKVDFSDVGDRKAELEVSYTGLRPSTMDTDWVNDLSGGREGSQSAEMGGWNALGAAAFHNKFRADKGGTVPLTHNWEWLHIRGAQIGGDTKAVNLMAGTFAANSAMIPYETQLERWHSGNHNRIFARFQGHARDFVLAEHIIIEVAAYRHPVLGTIDQAEPLSVTFFPLEDRIVDKLMGHLKGKAWREEGRVRGKHPTIGAMIALGPERVLPIPGLAQLMSSLTVPPRPAPRHQPVAPRLSSRQLVAPGGGAP